MCRHEQRNRVTGTCVWITQRHRKQSQCAGNRVTILSGRALFERDEAKSTEEERAIILEPGANQFGASVDSVANIITFQLGNVELPGQRNQRQLTKGGASARWSAVYPQRLFELSRQHQ
ncbi:MAG: chemotaxis protein CheW [Pseudohongiella sp.]|nr:chemotaxis protein CheW [Pseudohongiella sp.]